MAEIVRMPKLSDTMTEGVVAKWHKKTGDIVKSGELLADIETDKATMEFESFQDGVLLYIGVQEGKSAPIDSILAILGNAGEEISSLIGNNTSVVAPKPKNIEILKEIPKTDIRQEATTKIVTNTIVSGRPKASPLAKKLASEKGVNIGQVKGTGEGGRVIKRDIENYESNTVRLVQEESYTEVEVSQMRKTIARRLSESKFTAPHFYLTIAINMDSSIEARTVINEASNIKVSFNDLVIKAAALSLKKHPNVNASWFGDKIRYNNHIHIGVAVAVDEGLLVPVVRFADTKNLSYIAKEVKKLGEQAKEKKLQPADWQGNTFTISNLGMFGVEEFTSIINSPDACILAVGSINKVPVVKNNQIIPGNIMKVTLSCDHRVVDGATGAAFLQTFKKYLENPVLLVGEGNI